MDDDFFALKNRSFDNIKFTSYIKCDPLKRLEMKVCTLITIFAGILGAGSLLGSNVATQTITFSIEPISEISVSGDPPSFVAQQATPGQDPDDVVDNSTFYAVTTNGSAEKVVACLNAAMPTGTSLCLMAIAPTGAVSSGMVDLDTSNQNIVTGITQVAESNLQLGYGFETTVSAGTFSTTTRIVTFTLTP